MKTVNLSLLPKLAVALLALTAVASCSSADGTEREQIAQSQEDLRAESNRLASSRVFATFEQLPAGVAGSDDVVFVGSPIEGAVVVLDRATRRKIANLPPPPEGFVLPYIMRNVGDSRLAVLDAGGLPQPAPFVASSPRIYEYEFHRDPHDGFVAHLSRTISFESHFIGFAEDIAPLSHGRYVLSDAVLGELWTVDNDGTIRPALGNQSTIPGDGLFPLKFCPTMPEITVGGLPFLFSGSTLPGVAALTSGDGQLYFYSPCARGLFTIPIASLFDNRRPEERMGDIRPVSMASTSVAVEQLLGLAFNRFDPSDPYLYAADTLQLRIIRINVKNGKRQVVADDPRLFNFPSSANFLPPVHGISPLLVVSNQQHRTVLTNDAISEDMLQPPFLATEVIIR